MTTPRNPGIDPDEITRASAATRGLSQSVRGTIVPILGLSAALGLLSSGLFEATVGGRLLTSSTYRLNSALTDLFNQFARALAPITGKFADALADLIQWFLGLDEGMQNFIINAILWTSIISLAVRILGGLFGIIRSIFQFIGRFGGGIVEFFRRFGRGISAVAQSLVTLFTQGVGAWFQEILRAIARVLPRMQGLRDAIWEIRNGVAGIIEAFRNLRYVNLPPWFSQVLRILGAGGAGAAGAAAAGAGAALPAAGAVAAGAGGVGVQLLAQELARRLNLDFSVINQGQQNPFLFGGLSVPDPIVGGVRDVSITVAGSLIGADAADIVAEFWKIANRRGAFEGER